MNSAAIYARFSTDKQDARSIDDQLRRCRAFAKQRGLMVSPAHEYGDAAASGATLYREQFQKLLADARSRGGSPFESVLVDDLSRLSRDLGNTWQIVFEDLAAVGVRVIDCTTGQSSDAQGARLTFGALALVNDTFLQLVKTETHRGLEGRALAGFWAGGRCYGYRTVVEPNPPDPTHPRKVPVIDETEANTVRRIFQMYLEGAGLKSICAALNRDGIPAPYDQASGTHYAKKAGRGWQGSTARNILQNERYVGSFIWNKRKWVRVAGKKSKRSLPRPKSEWVSKTIPELAIVDAADFEKVQAKFEERATKRGGKRGPVLGDTRTSFLLAGLLRCGVCGGPVGMVATRKKAGQRYLTLGCRTHTSRGSAICPNNLTVSEMKLTAGLSQLVQDELFSTTTPEKLRVLFRQRAEAAVTAAASSDHELAKLEASITKATEAVRVTSAAFARMPDSDAMMARLREAEAELKTLTIQRSELVASRQPLEMPTDDVVDELFRDLQRVWKEADEGKSKAFWRDWVGPLKLVPVTDGPQRHYKVEGRFSISPNRPSGRLVQSGCGGRI